MDIIPVEERNNWISDLRPILIEMNKLSKADKIEGFKSEVIGKFVALKAVNYMSQQLGLVECDRELLEKDVEELRYRADNLGQYDENRLKEFGKTVTVTVPSTNKELQDLNLKVFIRNQARMKMLNKQISNE